MTWDPTISYGSIIAALSIIVSIVAVSWRNSLVIRLALHELGQLKLDVASVKAKIEHIAVLQQQLADGKERMDSLEQRVRDIEQGRRAQA